MAEDVADDRHQIVGAHGACAGALATVDHVTAEHELDAVKERKTKLDERRLLDKIPGPRSPRRKNPL